MQYMQLTESDHDLTLILKLRMRVMSDFTLKLVKFHVS